MTALHKLLVLQATLPWLELSRATPVQKDLVVLPCRLHLRLVLMACFQLLGRLPAQAAQPDSSAMTKELPQFQLVQLVTTPLEPKTNSVSPALLGLSVPPVQSQLAVQESTLSARQRRAHLAQQANTAQLLIKTQ